VCNYGWACFWNISIICFIILLVSSACCLISFLNSSLLLISFFSLTLASSSLASVEDLYSIRSSFYSRSSFLSCLFSFSNSAFLCSTTSSIETGLTFILVSQLTFSSLGWIPAGMKLVAFLSLKHSGCSTQVLSTLTSCRLFPTPFNQSWSFCWAVSWSSIQVLWSAVKTLSTLSLSLFQVFS